MSPETRRVIEALKWVRHEILALCEATEDDPLLARALQDAEGKQGAYARGRIKEAKGIRRTMAEVIAVKLSEIEDETGWRPIATAAQRCIVSALDEAAVAAIARAIAPHLADNRTPRDHDGDPIVSLKMHDRAERIAAELLPLWAQARRNALEEAAIAAGEAAWRHEGDDALSHGMDLGAVRQVRACVAAIRSLDPPGGAS